MRSFSSLVTVRMRRGGDHVLGMLCADDRGHPRQEAGKRQQYSNRKGEGQEGKNQDCLRMFTLAQSGTSPVDMLMYLVWSFSSWWEV